MIGEGDERLRDRLLEEFIAEASEHLDVAESVLVLAERGGLDPNDRAELFRAMHSIKGAAGYLGLSAIRRIAHAMESICQAADLRTEAGGGRWGLLLDGISELRRLVRSAVNDGQGDPALIEALEAAVPPTAEKPAPSQGARRSVEQIFLDVADQQLQSLRAASQRLSADPSDETGREMARRAIASLRSAAEYAGREDVAAVLGGAVQPDAAWIGGVLHALEGVLGLEGASRSADGGEGQPKLGNSSERSSELAAAQGAGQTLRVDQARVDLLIEQAGELVTVRNQMDHFLGSLEAEGCPASICRRGKAMAFALGRVVDEIQNLAVELRLVRLETVFRRIPRVVRDVSAYLGKDVRLEVEGGEVEVDKAVAEAVADPLIHMVRNAVDHGIEPAEERVVVGKPAEGTVRVTARRESGCVVVVVEDDGRGIDTDSVRAAAVRRGLLDWETASELSDEGVRELLFQPGFSTTSTVTEVSGRGVGLDVVRANVARLGGSVVMDSTPGAGCRVEMRLPVRMAARDVVLARAHSELLAIPLDGIVETLSVQPVQIRRVAGRPAIVRRGQVVPLVSLAEVAGFGSGEPRSGPREMLIVDVGGQPVGLVVEEIGQHCQVVVKPLDAALLTPGIDGAAVLADGRVALVVDPVALVASAA